MKVKSEREVAQSCPTLSDPMDYGPPGFSIHGIFQARVLEWGAIASERDIKEEKWENFWAGVCAPREGGNPETGVPVHRETPSQASLKGNCKVLENQAKQGLGGK